MTLNAKNSSIFFEALAAPVGSNRKLADAIKRTLAVSDQIAIYTMVVDAN